MKLNYEFSKLAIKDLDSIWHYTVKKWSVKQANKYFKEIIEGIDLICRLPESGKSIQEIKEFHRSKRVNSHLIIYKIEKTKILIDRILHQKMDIESQYIEYIE